MMKAKILTYKLGNECEVQTTMTRAIPRQRLLKIRVHNSNDRLEISEIVKKTLGNNYTTFSFADLQDEIVFSIILPQDFPMYYLNKEQLPKILTATLGKTLQEEESYVTYYFLQLKCLDMAKGSRSPSCTKSHVLQQV